MAQNYPEYVRRLRDYASLAEVNEYGRVVEGGTEYPLLRLTVPGERWLVITSGFHGEEPAGPLTLVKHFAHIAAYAREHGVGLRVYPCINPSGFEDGTRYNRGGERMNNDFLRYETAPGVWKDRLADQEEFVRWVLYDQGPQETRAVRADIARYPAPIAALDIHQDNFLQVDATYAYSFGDSAPYRRLMEASSAHARVLRSEKVGERDAEVDAVDEIENERREEALLEETSERDVNEDTLQRCGDGLRDSSWRGRTALFRYDSSER